jgi:copper homeostasis protein
LSKPLEFTFHRGFDEVANPLNALEQLIDLGVNRILTSGQAINAEKGIDLIEQLHRQSDGRISIMAGAGINDTNAAKFKAIGLKEIHTSASVEVLQSDGLFLNPQTISDKEKIKSILQLIE